MKQVAKMYVKLIGLFMWGLLLHGTSFAQNDFFLNLADKPAENKAADSGAKIESKDGKYDVSLHGYAMLWGIVKKFDKFEYADLDQAKVNGRVQLKFEGNLDTWGHVLSAMNFNLTFDAMHPRERSYDKLANFDVVETYFDWYAAKWLSVRAGRQFILWGEIEGIEAPTDIITPWNFDTETIEFEDSRLAPTAIAFNIFFYKNQKIELIWLPIFTPNRLPVEEVIRRGTPSTGVFTVIPRLTPPAYDIKNGEYAFRISGTIANIFRYGAGFLYGFDDMPDADIIYNKGGGNVPLNVKVNLINNPIMISTIDLGCDIKDRVTVKGVAALYKTKDWDAKIDEFKNSTVKYLAGIESANLFWDIFFSLYLGQMWVINYTKEHQGTFASNPAGVVVQNELPNYDILLGYDQLYRYKWLLTNTVQRTFLQGNALQLIVTYALSASPKWDAIDYAINASVGYKIIAGLSMSLGGVFSQKMGSVRNYIILNMKYVF